jgi:hypothetical protein
VLAVVNYVLSIPDSILGPTYGKYRLRCPVVLLTLSKQAPLCDLEIGHDHSLTLPFKFANCCALAAFSVP